MVGRNGCAAHIDRPGNRRRAGNEPLANPRDTTRRSGERTTSAPHNIRLDFRRLSGMVSLARKSLFAFKLHLSEALEHYIT